MERGLPDILPIAANLLQDRIEGVEQPFGEWELSGFPAAVYFEAKPTGAGLELDVLTDLGYPHNAFRP